MERKVSLDEVKRTLDTVYHLVSNLKKHLIPEFSDTFSISEGKRVLNIEIPLKFSADPLEVRCYDFKTREQIYIFKYKKNIKAYTIVDIRNDEHIKDFPMRFIR